MGGSEFLRRLQPLKADMEAAYFRVYQPFHVREEDFDALLALLDEQAQKRPLNLQPAAVAFLLWIQPEAGVIERAKFIPILKQRHSPQSQAQSLHQ
jgi:hypothetical protein